jgi:hypothetical protein
MQFFFNADFKVFHGGNPGGEEAENARTHKPVNSPWPGVSPSWSLPVLLEKALHELTEDSARVRRPNSGSSGILAATMKLGMVARITQIKKCL